MILCIGAQRVRVQVYSKTPKDADTASQGGNWFGDYDPKTNIIRLMKGHPDIMRDTLLHEIIHAVLSITGVSRDLSDPAEERIVRALAPALDALLDWRIK